MIRYLARCTLLAALLLSQLTACSSLVKPEKDLINKDLIIIQRAYEAAVASAHEDAELSWNNGRMGNIVVNINGGNHRGLCYHWQRLVYNGIQPALRETGWQATGIAINEGSYFEHHAVLVYDPSHSEMMKILDNPDNSDVYVLDPWSSGQARIYTLNNWLRLPVTIRKPARLTRVIRHGLNTGS